MNKKEKKDSKKKKKVESEVYGDEFEEQQENYEIIIDENINQERKLEDNTEEQLYS